MTIFVAYLHKLTKKHKIVNSYQFLEMRENETDLLSVLPHEESPPSETRVHVQQFQHPDYGANSEYLCHLE